MKSDLLIVFQRVFEMVKMKMSKKRTGKSHIEKNIQKRKSHRVCIIPSIINTTQIVGYLLSITYHWV